MRPPSRTRVFLSETVKPVLKAPHFPTRNSLFRNNNPNTSIDESESRAERQRKLALHMLAKMDKVLHMVSHEIREARIASADDVQKNMKENLAIITAGGSVADPTEPTIPPSVIPRVIAVAIVRGVAPPVLFQITELLGGHLMHCCLKIVLGLKCVSSG